MDSCRFVVDSVTGPPSSLSVSELDNTPLVKSFFNSSPGSWNAVSPSPPNFFPSIPLTCPPLLGGVTGLNLTSESLTKIIGVGFRRGSCGCLARSDFSFSSSVWIGLKYACSKWSPLGCFPRCCVWSCWPVVSFCDFDIATSTPISKLASRGLLITPATYSELGLRILSCSAVSGYGVNYKITWSLYVVIELNAHRHTHTHTCTRTHAHAHVHTHTHTPTHPHTHTHLRNIGEVDDSCMGVCIHLLSWVQEVGEWGGEEVGEWGGEGVGQWGGEVMKVKTLDMAQALGGGRMRYTCIWSHGGEGKGLKE